MKKILGILSATFLLLALVGCNGAGTNAIGGLSSGSSSDNSYDNNDDEFDGDIFDENEFDENVDEESSSSEIVSDEIDDDDEKEESSSSNVKSSSSSDTESSSSTISHTTLMLIQEYESKYDFFDDGWRDECLRLANEYRATEGVAPLVLADDDAQWCAIQQAAADMADNKPHGHFRDCDEWAQNSTPNISIARLANATESVRGSLKRMWEDEKALVTSGQRDPDKDEDYSYIGHYLNMRKASYTKVACGIAISEDGTKGWFNMNLY